MLPENFSIIASKVNKQVKHCAKLVSSRKYRREQGLFVAEGQRLCEDAVRSGLQPEQTLITEAAVEKCGPILDCSKQVFVITEELATKISDTQTPQGVFCVFRTLDNGVTVDTIKWQRVLMLSSLQDPGNIGTIIRTCEAFGIDGLILSADCPDLYAPKVLRSTMGGVFRLPIRIVESMEEEILRLRQEGFTVYATALSEKSVPITDLSFQGKVAAVIGNEGNGLDPKVIHACDGQTIIPMAGKAESLNAAVAASIVIWEMCRP